MEPTAANYHLGLGECYFFQEPPDYPAAIAEFKRAVELKPSWADGYLWLANAMMENGEAEAAVSYYERAGEFAPDDPRPAISLGRCFAKLKRYDDAIRMFRRGIELKPHYGKASAHLFLAEALLACRAIDQARREWEVVLTLKPMYPEHESAADTAREMLAKHKR